METSYTRRRLLGLAAAAGAVAAAPAGAIARWGPVRQLGAAEGCGERETAGLLLLSPDEPAPACIRPPARPDPTVCGAEKDPGPMARAEDFADARALADAVAFPVYALGSLPAGLEAGGASLIRHPAGEPFTAGARYRRWNPEIDRWETVVQVWSTPDFPRPYPLRSVAPDPEDAAGEGGLVLEAVDTLPQPGVLAAFAGGFVGHWVEDDVLYRLVDEHSATRAEADALAAALTRLT